MKEELTKKEESLAKIIAEDGVTKAISPLVKEIPLFSTYVSGTSYIEEPEVLQTLKEGDELILQRDTENKFDPNAIRILTKEKKRIGYIPAKDSRFIVALLDYGKLLTGKVLSLSFQGSFATVRIEIRLVDY